MRMRTIRRVLPEPVVVEHYRIIEQQPRAQEQAQGPTQCYRERQQQAFVTK
jgi:hypothetical protein